MIIGPCVILMVSCYIYIYIYIYIILYDARARELRLYDFSRAEIENSFDYALLLWATTALTAVFSCVPTVNPKGSDYQHLGLTFEFSQSVHFDGGSRCDS